VRSKILIVIAALAGAATAAQEPVAESLQPIGEQLSREIILPLGAAPGAEGLAFEATCSDIQPGRGLVTVAWRPLAAGGGAQRIDVTALRDGFARGRFDVTRSLGETIDSAVLGELVPGLNYYWRVLRRTEAGWAPSETARFEAPICPVDSMLEGPEAGQ